MVLNQTSWSRLTVSIALSGSKHLDILLKHDLIMPAPSTILDQLYESTTKRMFRKLLPKDMRSSKSESNVKPPEDAQLDREMVFLQQADAQRFADALEVPELTVELERAVKQVEASMEPIETLDMKDMGTMSSITPSEKEVKK